MSMNFFHRTQDWPDIPIVTLSKPQTYGFIEWHANPYYQWTFPDGVISNSVRVYVDLRAYMSFNKEAKFNIKIDRWDGTTWQDYLLDRPHIDITKWNEWETVPREYIIGGAQQLVPNDKKSYLEFQVTVWMQIGGAVGDDDDPGSDPHDGPQQTTQYLAIFPPPVTALKKEWAKYRKSLKGEKMKPAKRLHSLTGKTGTKG